MTGTIIGIAVLAGALVVTVAAIAYAWRELRATKHALDRANAARDRASAAATAASSRAETPAGLSIRTVGNGTGSIHYNGHDLSLGVRGVTVRSRVGRPDEVKLDMHVREGVRIGTEAAPGVTASTREALIRLGWQPPKEET